MQPGDGSHRVGQLLLTDQRDRVDRDALAADVVAVGFGHRALRHHADLGAAADHDHALAIDPLEGRNHVHALDALDAFQVLDETGLVDGSGDLDLELRHVIPPCAARDVLDVGAMPVYDLGDPVEHARLVAGDQQQAEDRPGVRHG